MFQCKDYIYNGEQQATSEKVTVARTLNAQMMLQRSTVHVQS